MVVQHQAQRGFKMDREKNIIFIVSSKSPKDVLINTRVLHDLEGDSVYWFTEPKYFDIIPASHVAMTVDINSNEAVMMFDIFDIDVLYQFDRDLRGLLLGAKAPVGKVCGSIITSRGYEERDPTPYTYTNKKYLYDYIHTLDDYVYQVVGKKLQHARSLNVIGIYFNAESPNRKMPFTEYMEIIERLFTESIASAVILFGDEDENAVRAHAITSKMKNYYIINAVGKIKTTKQLANAFHLCHAILAEDSFGLHLAVAINSKVVGLYGHTVREGIDIFPDNIRTVVTEYGFKCGFKCEACPVEENCWNCFNIDTIINAIKEETGTNHEEE